MVELTLPFPPTVNHYLVKTVRRRNGKHFVHVAISSKGILYRASCLQEVLKRRLTRSMWEGRLRVEMRLFMPDRRKRDIDNYTKVLFDALSQARLWQDDEQIDELRIVKAGVKPPGQVVIRVESYGNAPGL